MGTRTPMRRRKCACSLCFEHSFPSILKEDTVTRHGWTAEKKQAEHARRRACGTDAHIPPDLGFGLDRRNKTENQRGPGDSSGTRMRSRLSPQRSGCRPAIRCRGNEVPGPGIRTAVQMVIRRRRMVRSSETASMRTGELVAGQVRPFQLATKHWPGTRL